jgi:pilus assembly protein Flp/PilA
MMRKLKQRLFRVYLAIQDQAGQDLVEYALVVALIALAATAGMSTLANNLNTAFTNIGGKVSTYMGS